MGTDKWQFDALELQMGFLEYMNNTRPVQWTSADAETMEHYCNALMQLTRQMDAGQRPKATDKCGTLVSFDDIPQVLNQIAVCAVRMVLSGAHYQLDARTTGGE